MDMCYIVIITSAFSGVAPCFQTFTTYPAFHSKPIAAIDVFQTFQSFWFTFVSFDFYSKLVWFESGASTMILTYQLPQVWLFSLLIPYLPNLIIYFYVYFLTLFHLYNPNYTSLSKRIWRLIYDLKAKHIAFDDWHDLAIKASGRLLLEVQLVFPLPSPPFLN